MEKLKCKNIMQDGVTDGHCVIKTSKARVTLNRVAHEVSTCSLKNKMQRKEVSYWHVDKHITTKAVDHKCR